MYLVGLYIYYKMIHGPYNVKNIFISAFHDPFSNVRSFILMTTNSTKHMWGNVGDKYGNNYRHQIDDYACGAKN